MEKKQKRFYKVGEMVWVVGVKKEGTIKSINRETLEVVVTIKADDLVERGTGKILASAYVEETLKMWEIDKLKYKAKEKLTSNKKDKLPVGKTTYLSSVKGGVIPTKEAENAGRDCYARLEPKMIDGKEVFELHMPKLTLSKIPLGFASYLNVEDLLSLKHERSSIGSTGLIILSGLIDSTYQGEVILQVVPLIADVVISSEVKDKYYDESTNTYFVPYHKAIAQAVIIKQSDAEDVHLPYEDLLKKPSNRGTGGWGSSGK